MRGQSVVFIVRLWRSVKGQVQASVRSPEGGETRYFKDLDDLESFLTETKRDTFWERQKKPSGLR